MHVLGIQTQVLSLTQRALRTESPPPPLAADAWASIGTLLSPTALSVSPAEAPTFLTVLTNLLHQQPLYSFQDILWG